MTHEEVLIKFSALFREIADDDTIELHDATTADDIEVWDSVFHVKLIIATESEFGIRFEVEEINSAANVNEFVELVLSKL